MNAGLNILNAKKFSRERQTAAPAVIPSPPSPSKSAFTLIEVMVVVLLIGILSSLAYSSLMDLIFANRARETAQVIRSFTEKSIAEAKRMGTPVRIYLNAEDIVADTGTAPNAKEFSRMALSSGFRMNTSLGSINGIATYANASVSSDFLGVSGVTTAGYLAACGARSYCGAAVKFANENSFKAHIRKGASPRPWEAL